MGNEAKFYINGAWVEPLSSNRREVMNPATEQSVGTIAMGTAEDVDVAVAAAKAAFATFSQTTVAERLALLTRITEVYKTRMGDIATAVTSEMGAPAMIASRAQAPAGLVHDLGKHDGVERCHLRWLQHHGAAGCDSRGNLGNDLIERPVPWSDERAHANGLVFDTTRADIFGPCELR